MPLEPSRSVGPHGDLEGFLERIQAYKREGSAPTDYSNYERFLTNYGTEEIKAFLASGHDINEPDPAGRTLLATAVGMLKHLAPGNLEKAEYRHSMKQVYHNFSSNVVVTSGMFSGEQQREIEAFRQKLTNIIVFLVQRGANVNTEVSPGSFMIKKPLLEHLIEGKSDGLVQFFLKSGAEVKPGYLITAINNGLRPDTLDLLLSKGANPDEKDYQGLTGLHYLAISQQKADLDSDYEKQILEKMWVLLKHDADPRIQTERGETILDRVTNPRYDPDPRANAFPPTSFGAFGAFSGFAPRPTMVDDGDFKVKKEKIRRLVYKRNSLLANQMSRGNKTRNANANGSGSGSGSSNRPSLNGGAKKKRKASRKNRKTRKARK